MGNQNFSFCHDKTTRHKKEGNKNEQFGNHSDRNGGAGSRLCLLRKMACKKWGIDEKAKTPAFTHEDGEDFVPSSKFTVFSHQFSSIAGAGPVTGPILASVFGWVPVLLWLLIGGLFFGAVQDFGALYASVKNEGKSMGMIIENTSVRPAGNCSCCSAGCSLC